MKDFLVNFIKLFLSILIIFFIEEYFFKLMGLIGITLHKTALVSLIIYLLEFILIYIIYNKEVSSAFGKFQNKFGSNVIYSLIAFIVLFISMMITNYIVKLIAANLQMPYDGLNFINIFNKSFDFDLIVLFITKIIIVPFVKVVIFVLGVNNLVKGKAGMFMSALTYALYEGFLIGGNFGTVFINIIDEFVLFLILSYIYRNNSNIAFSIITFILYGLLSGLLITKIG
jgi:hypothetical protein